MAFALGRWTAGTESTANAGSADLVEPPPSTEVDITTTTTAPATSEAATPSTERVTPAVHRIASAEDWLAAIAVAIPGDTLLLVENVGRLVYSSDADEGGAPSGTAEAPITISAEPDVWIDPGNQSNNLGALDMERVSFVHVDGVRIRNSQFGLRMFNVTGSDESPFVVRNTTIQDIGHSALAVQFDFDTLEPSSHLLIENNTIARTGRTAPRFGEGIYLGTGATNYVDESHDITVRNNDISELTAEAIDVKPGTRSILIEGNRIHDLAPIDGGAISAHYAGLPNPNPEELDSVVIRGNRIWNQNLSGEPGANDWAIWVGHGGVTIEENVIWGLRDAPSTRAVRVRALADFGPHPILVRNNVFWTAAGALAEGEPSGAANLVSEGNIGPVTDSSMSAVSPDSFTGPVPAQGEASLADAGAGPGSAFEPLPAAS